ncbi:MAG: hypothetical protein OJF50_005625 [Nitrospira sp.]|jgi:uncharacterized membrane protein|nr:hypothetical protein [Nitrospira sp.]
MIVSMNVDELDAKLRAWREEDNTPEKVAVTHRKVMLDRVVQSMAFENQPVSMKRLKTLTGFPRVKASWALLENST